ncbi:MAG: ribosome biogenesis GTPase YlqF [Phycisphaeraceae bacterium]
MPINWFPGHMNTTRQKLADLMPKCDVVVEMLDARLPASSSNPLLDELRRDIQGKGEEGRNGDLPCVTVFNKVDLADPQVTKAWRELFEKQRGVKTVAISVNEPGEADRVVRLVKKFAPRRLEKGLKVRVLVVGIPNVGKSTLVNALRGKRVASVGDEPAVTKGNQEIDLKNGIVLIDTPGILWPKFEDENVGYRLAVSGAIKDTAIDYDDVAVYAARYLADAYPHELRKRYKLKELPEDAIQLLTEIGKKRGCLVGGGEVDLNRAGELLLREMRSGKLGRISLEHPDMESIEHETEPPEFTPVPPAPKSW